MLPPRLPRSRIAASGLTLATTDYFDQGVLTWLTGANAGLRMDVRAVDGTTVELMFAMPFTVAPGDTFSIVAGCNKSLGACINKFDNVLNHRGKAHAPVTDDTIKGPVSGESAFSGYTPPSANDGGPGGD